MCRTGRGDGRGIIGHRIWREWESGVIELGRRRGGGGEEGEREEGREERGEGDG